MITALGLQYLGAQETKRSNLAKEAETKRSNLVNEGIKASSLDETKRSNLVNEAETHRSHIANELETARSNVAKESETRRHNLQTENVARGQLEEAVRSNRVQEWLKQQLQDRNYSIDKANLAIAESKLTDQLLNSAIGRELQAAQTEYTQGKNVREYFKSATDIINNVFDFISKRGTQIMEALGNVLK